MHSERAAFRAARSDQDFLCRIQCPKRMSAGAEARRATARACGAHDVQQAIEHDGMSKHMSRDEHTSKQVSVPMPTNTYAAHDIEQAIEHDGSGADSLAAHRRYWMPLIIVWIRIKYLRTHARARACAWMRVRACARIGAIGCHSTEHLPRARGCV